MSKDFSKLWELGRLVQEFEKLDAKLIIAFEEWGIDDFNDIFTKVIGLKTRVQEIISIELKEPIDASFAQKLKQIRDNFGYNIDRLIPDEHWRDGQKEIAAAEMWEQYLEREEDVDYFYLQRKKEIGTIICSTALKQNIIRNLENIKECYANGLFDAAIIYCRALIEYVTFVLRKRKGLIPKNAPDYCERNLDAAINQIERFINSKTFRYIKHIKNLANNILHSKDDIYVNSCELTPFEAIKWTFIFVEEVYNVK
jgi:hypothetical protein